MAIYAIGDIHGSLVALKTIFDQGIITHEDTVVFLGDYVDRGPDSKGVIDWLLKHKALYHFEFLLGNHEIMMIVSKAGPVSLRHWLQFGGAETLDSYGIKDAQNWTAKIDQAHWDFLDSCKSYLKIAPFIFVHAGLEKGKALKEQDDHDLFWKKYKTPEKYKASRTVICGHTSRKNGEIADFGHTICIDTYAHGGQWLTCLNVETRGYIKANNAGEVVRGVSYPIFHE